MIKYPVGIMCDEMADPSIEVKDMAKRMPWMKHLVSHSVNYECVLSGAMPQSEILYYDVIFELTEEDMALYVLLYGEAVV